jgi:hypothetical protein
MQAKRIVPSARLFSRSLQPCDSDVIRTAHARYLAEKPTSSPCGKARQREVYTWFTTELSNLVSTIRSLPDFQGDSASPRVSLRRMAAQCVMVAVQLWSVKRIQEDHHE